MDRFGDLELKALASSLANYLADEMETRAQPLQRKYITVQEASKIYGVSADSINKVISAGHLRIYKLPGVSLRLISIQDMDGLIERGTTFQEPVVSPRRSKRNTGAMWDGVTPPIRPR